MPGGLTQIGVVSVPFSNTTPQTTAALNTTGAVLIVLELAYSTFIGSGASVSDGKGNTLTAGTGYVDSSGIAAMKQYRCISPGTVGSGHTWTVTGSGPAPSGRLTAYAYSDSNGAPTYFNESGFGTPNTSQTSAQPGSLTPSANNSLCITGINFTGTPTSPGVNSGYSVDVSQTTVFTASQIQGTAAALNPTWSWTGSQGAAVAQIIFTPAAGGGGGTNVATGVGALALTGFSPTIALSDNKNVLSGVGALTLTGFAPTVAVTGNVNVLTGVGALILTGFAPTAVGGGNTNVLADVGALVLTGFAPTVTVTNNINVLTGVGALVLTGFSPTVFATNLRNILTGVGALVFTGFAPTVVATGTATQTVVTGQPTTCITQRVFTSNVVVAVKDAGGSTVTTDTSPIVLVLVVLSGVAQFYSGTYLRSAVAGVATFNDIAVICSEGSQFLVAAVRSGLTTGSSTAITGSVRSNDVTATVT